jgi:spermidine synthase
MMEKLLKQYSINIQKKLYESDDIAVYQTETFGNILTQNGQIILSERESFFLHEMLTHPALFVHPKPTNITIVGHCFGILPEILKHPNITTVNVVAANSPVADLVKEFLPAF